MDEWGCQKFGFCLVCVWSVTFHCMGRWHLWWHTSCPNDSVISLLHTCGCRQKASPAACSCPEMLLLAHSVHHAWLIIYLRREYVSGIYLKQGGSDRLNTHHAPPGKERSGCVSDQLLHGEGAVPRMGITCRCSLPRLCHWTWPFPCLL